MDFTLIPRYWRARPKFARLFAPQRPFVGRSWGFVITIPFWEKGGAWAFWIIGGLLGASARWILQYDESMGQGYGYKARGGSVTIGGRVISVDSENERKVIQWLDTHGFADRWRRPIHGLAVWGARYTPDLELMVSWAGVDTLAIVEIKATVEQMTSDIVRRMVAVSKHYPTDLILLYVSKGNTWYRVNKKSLGYVPCSQPAPALVGIEHYKSPKTMHGSKLYGKEYRRRFSWLQVIAIGLLFVLEGFIQVLVGSSKSRRKR